MSAQVCGVFTHMYVCVRKRVCVCKYTIPCIVICLLFLTISSLLLLSNSLCLVYYHSLMTFTLKSYIKIVPITITTINN